MSDQLLQFIDHAREKGLDHATIRQVLVSAGWRERDVAEAMCSRELEMPIPRPAGLAPATARPTRRKGSIWPERARDGFLHLLTFGSLYAWATSLVLLYFVCINFAFPDPAFRLSHSQLVELLSVMRAEIAVLIVAFPVFLLVWQFLLRSIRRHPEKAHSGIRRWLGYLALFVGGITLAGDAMTLIYFLLEGQLTTRFLLKAGVLFLIAGGLVTYLGWTLRSESQQEVVS